MKKNPTVDAYIEKFPKDTQVLLSNMRKIIKKAAPKAEETVKYGIPTFVQNGNLVHFGGFKNHVGFFPTPSAITLFAGEFSKYKRSKGAVQFPINEPLPVALITKVVRFRVRESVSRV